MRQDCIHFDDKMVWDMTAFILWQDCMRQDSIHFYDKMAWDRTASIFHSIVWDRTASILMTRWYETWLHSFYDKIVCDRLHPFLWQNGMRQDCIYFSQYCIRQDCIHFYDKMAWGRAAFFLTRLYETGLHSFLMTSQHKTGTHPFLWQASIIPVLINFYDKLDKPA